MPFDKYKEKETLERKERLKETLLFNSRLALLKKSVIPNDPPLPNDSFLDRLMQKNFNLYC